MNFIRKKKFIIPVSILFFVASLYLSSGSVLIFLGEWLIAGEPLEKSDAAVVLNTGIEYYPRLIEAADLYNKGLVKKVVINGNRKTDILRKLEEKGFIYCCPWYEEKLQILELYNVRRNDVVTLSVEDVYDTVGESEAVGKELIKLGLSRLLLVTSKYHTRRARHIWRNVWPKQFEIGTVAARTDPYNPLEWWKSGRQIKWVLSEYGAWVYYWWNRLLGGGE